MFVHVMHKFSATGRMRRPDSLAQIMCRPIQNSHIPPHTYLGCGIWPQRQRGGEFDSVPRFYVSWGIAYKSSACLPSNTKAATTSFIGELIFNLTDNSVTFEKKKVPLEVHVSTALFHRNHLMHTRAPPPHVHWNEHVLWARTEFHFEYYMTANTSQTCKYETWGASGDMTRKTLWRRNR